MKNQKNSGMSLVQLPEKVKWILNTLTAQGYEAYAVGGCVRDSLLGRVPKDWDITTSAKPWQVKELFPRTLDTGIQHGTVTVMQGKEGFEITTYRIDGDYADGRHPKEVMFTPNLAEDLKRRDFTINAMAYNETEGLVDLFDGAGDLANKVIRCVGNPKERFQEDALRLLRALRFAAQLDFSIEVHTKEAIQQLSDSLRRISAERIQAELVKLLTSPHPEWMRQVYTLGISSVILPEFDQMMETEQNHPHHQYTVGEHTIQSMCQIAPDKVLRLTMLFHDVAKPACRTVDAQGIDHFYGHPQLGEKMTRGILRRLKFDRDTMDRVCALIRWHDDNPKLEERLVRRAITRTGLKQFPAMFAVKRADILAQSDYQRTEKLAYVDAYEKLYQQILARGNCLSVKQLAISGRDLLDMGIPQGKQIGELLNQLLELVLEEPERNTREQLLEYVRNRN